ncbi:hypothetical protein C5167_002059, partial [Papaver somniferum]
ISRVWYIHKHIILHGPIALNIAPTRELVQQIHKDIMKFAKVLGIRSVPVNGGSQTNKQINALKNGAEIVGGRNVVNKDISQLVEVRSESEWLLRNDVSKILIATSIAARGLDVKELELVINFHVPNHYEDYIHRVGRTGRDGRKES